MMLRFVLALVAVLAASTAARATTQRLDVTDMWFDGSESGWGLSLVHQGNTVFGALFVYGPDGAPTWYVAPDLTGGNDGPFHDGTFAFSGPLYTSSGTWFGAPTFDPAASVRRQVGTLTVDLTGSPGTLDYTIEGVHVTKPLSRYTFRRTNLLGLHRAYEFQPASDAGPEIHHSLERFAIVDDGSNVTIDASDDSEPDCRYVGNHAQDGQYEIVSGTYSCGDNGSAGQGAWSMTVDPTPEGFTGFFTGNGITSPWGRIVAALAAPPKMEGTGWRNGMWFVPSESGWGLSVIEQNDIVFATLYVYDAAGKPHWYVGSALAQSGATSDGSAVNSGPLYEASGPYFGAASFDPSAVRYRQVGTMSFQARGPGSGVLSYTVDGVSVTKDVTQFPFARSVATGTYNGQITDANGIHDPAVITIQDQGSTLAMRIQGMYGGTCDYSGPLQQLGATLYASGSVSCGASSSASFVLKDLAVSFNGITGRVELDNVTGFVQDGLTSFDLAGANTTPN